METQKIKVSRTVEVPGQKDVERSTTVSFRNAQTAAEALELCGNDVGKFMGYFNSGRWAELRTQISNTLANKTPQQRAVDKMISAFKLMNPKLSDTQLRAMALAVPGIADAAGTGVEDVLPAETDEAYFAAKKADVKAESNGDEAKTDAPANEATA